MTRSGNNSLHCNYRKRYNQQWLVRFTEPGYLQNEIVLGI